MFVVQSLGDIVWGNIIRPYVAHNSHTRDVSLNECATFSMRWSKCTYRCNICVSALTMGGILQEVDLGKSVKATQTNAAPMYNIVSACTPGEIPLSELRYPDDPEESEGDESGVESSEVEGGAAEVLQHITAPSPYLWDSCSPDC